MCMHLGLKNKKAYLSNLGPISQVANFISSKQVLWCNFLPGSIVTEDIPALSIWKPVSIRFWPMGYTPLSDFVTQWNDSHCPPCLSTIWHLLHRPLCHFVWEQKLPISHSDKTVASPNISMLEAGSLHSVSMSWHWYSELVTSKWAQKRAYLLDLESNEQLSPILYSFPVIWLIQERNHISTSSGWKIAPFLICHQEMWHSYFWGSFIMENRISNSCHSNQIPRGIGPVAI